MGLNREKALRMLWKDLSTVVVREERIDPETKLTDFVEVTLIEDEPCKLSFETMRSTQEDHAAAATQETKLFLPSELVIPAGSKIIVTRADRTFEFARSGEPEVYTHHQEIPLEKWKRWA